ADQNEKAAAGTLAEARTSTAAEHVKFSPVEQQVRQQRGAFIKARDLLDRQRALVTDLQQQKTQAESLIALDEAAKQQARLRRDLADVDARNDRQQLALTAAAQLLSRTTTDHARIRTAYNAAEAELKSTSTRLTAKKQAAPLLSASRDAAIRAQALLAGDADVAQVANKLTQVKKGFELQLAAVAKLNATRQSQYEQAKRNLDQSAGQLSKAADAVNVVKAMAEMIGRRLQELTAANRVAETNHQQAMQVFSKQASANFQVAVVDALTPEQMVWSLLECSGQMERQRQSEHSRLQKEKPLNAEQLKDAAQLAARRQAADEAAYTKLQKTVATFVKLYGNQTGQPQDAFFATVDQALFLANGKELSDWLKPAGDNLTARLARLKKTEKLAEELYLSVFSRQPTPAEVEAVDGYLKRRNAERPAAIQEMAWALLTSAEFRFHR
ncbi:MAG: hypothetical protein ABGZ17_28460, partial [Planctomycetaceae bacterium]